MLTAEELRTVVAYDPETGIFRAKTKRLGSYRKIGDKLGTVNALGYVVLRVEKKLYLGHRLAFLYMTGEWPESGLDHANGIQTDNRWSNLRLATQTQNLRNTRRRSNNVSGFKGVFYDKRRNRWIAALKVDGRVIRAGSFRCPKIAHEAYMAAAIRHFGEFARAG